MQFLIRLLGVFFICYGFSELTLLYLGNTDDLGFELYKNLAFIFILAIGSERLLVMLITALFGPVKYLRKNFRVEVIKRENGTEARD